MTQPGWRPRSRAMGASRRRYRLATRSMPPMVKPAYVAPIATIANVAAAICFAVTGLLLSRHLTGTYLVAPRSFSIGRLRQLLSYGSGLATNSLFTLLFSPFNRLVIARFAGFGTVPVYDIAFSGSMRLRNIFESGQKALLPEIGRVLGASPDMAYARMKDLGAQALRAFRWVLPLYAIAFIFAGPALRLWLGARYNPELAPATRIILIGTFFSLLGTPAFYILAAVGRLKILLIGNIIQSGSNIFLVAVYLLAFHTLSASLVLSAAATSMPKPRRGRHASTTAPALPPAPPLSIAPAPRMPRSRALSSAMCIRIRCRATAS